MWTRFLPACSARKKRSARSKAREKSKTSRRLPHPKPRSLRLRVGILISVENHLTPKLLPIPPPHTTHPHKPESPPPATDSTPPNPPPTSHAPPQARISTTRNRFHASRYGAHFARLLPAVKCSVSFFPIAAYGMMYHSPTGITHTAKKSTVPFLYCFLPGPITFKLYSFPRRQ